MFLVILAACAGIALRLILRGGSLALPERTRALPALLAGFVFVAAAEWLPLPGRAGIFIVGSLLMVIGLVQNYRFAGAVITASGLLLTGFVVLVNGHLPLRSEAAEAAGVSPTGLRELETDDTRLGILGDVVPIGPFVLSFGDLIAAAGAFILGRRLPLPAPDGDLDVDEFLAEFDGPDIDLREPVADLDLDGRFRTPPPPVFEDLYEPRRTADD